MTGGARAAVRRLRTGVVPEWVAEGLSVGYGKVRVTIAEALDFLASGRQPPPLFVRGEWGTGKTHFLTYVRAATESRRIPSSHVDLNAWSAPLNHPQRFFGLLTAGVRVNGLRGLREVLTSILCDVTRRHHIGTFARSQAAGDLRGALSSLVARFERGDSFDVGADSAWAVLQGSDLSWADYAYKREQALARIHVMGRLLRAGGLGGLVLMFDEGETIDHLWNIRSRMSAYSVLGQLCRFDAVQCVFGITERFDRVVHTDLGRGALELEYATESARWFLRSWLRQELTIIEPPVMDQRHAVMLASRIVKLYQHAYPTWIADSGIVEDCVEEWIHNPGRNPRRLIRVLIHRLDSARPLHGTNFNES